MSLQQPRPSMPRGSVALGFALRRWRVFNRVKQSHAAEFFGVAQSTVSRWESGAQAMETAEQLKVEATVGANVDAAADGVLAQLVFESTRPIHLICDLTHCLLAWSAAREREFGIEASALRGRSMRRFATDELSVQEAQLEGWGWYDVSIPEPVIVETGANRSRLVPIRPGQCRWTRLTLSTGAVARLVETL